MKRILLAGVGLLAAALVSGAANAQDTIKIGVIAAFSASLPTPRPRSRTVSSST